jgi:hypothetical protein
MKVWICQDCGWDGTWFVKVVDSKEKAEAWKKTDRGHGIEDHEIEEVEIE